MWTLLVIYGVIVVGIPIFWYWAWRGRFPHIRLTGTRLEDHRKQAWRGIKLGLPIWGLALLQMVGQVVELSSPSREVRLFWAGFLIASDLFLLGLAFANALQILRGEREKRRQRETNGMRRDSL